MPSYPQLICDESTNEVVYYLFEIDDLELFDERVGSLELIPMADYATAPDSKLDIDATITTTDGESTNTETAKISVVVKDLADAIPIAFESATLALIVNSPKYQYDSIANDAASVTTYEGCGRYRHADALWC